MEKRKQIRQSTRFHQTVRPIISMVNVTETWLERCSVPLAGIGDQHLLRWEYGKPSGETPGTSANPGTELPSTGVVC